MNNDLFREITIISINDNENNHIDNIIDDNNHIDNIINNNY